MGSGLPSHRSPVGALTARSKAAVVADIDSWLSPSGRPPRRAVLERRDDPVPGREGEVKVPDAVLGGRGDEVGVTERKEKSKRNGALTRPRR